MLTRVTRYSSYPSFRFALLESVLALHAENRVTRVTGNRPLPWLWGRSVIDAGEVTWQALAVEADALSRDLGCRSPEAASRPRAWRPDAARANVGGVVASGAGSAAGIWTRPPTHPDRLVGANAGGACER